MPRRDWRHRFSVGFDKALIALGLYKPALVLFHGWRNLHQRVVHMLAKWAYSRPWAEAMLRSWLRVAPLPRTRKLCDASLATIRARRALDEKSVPDLLEMMVEFEKLESAAPVAAARTIHELLSTDDGRDELAEAAGHVLNKCPDSPYLIYLRSASLAKGGKLSEAHHLVMNAIRRCEEATSSGAPDGRIDRRLKRLENAWRVIDSISRDDATWSDGSSRTPEWAKDDVSAPDGTTYGDVLAGDDDSDGSIRVFSEQLIQGRQHERYLEACKRDFDTAQGVFARFKSLREMVREARRAIVSYRPAYDLAAACFEQTRPEWEHLTDLSYLDNRINWGRSRETARALAEALHLSRLLRLGDDVAKLERSLLHLASKPSGAPALWYACNALVSDKTDTHVETTIGLITKARRDPEAEADIRQFFVWARQVQRYDLAHAVFDRLPQKKKARKTSLQYAQILQQEGQFARAADLVRAVHEEVLRHPGTLNPNFSWTQIRRVGELEFAAETAGYLAAVPQPSVPRGVIFLAPRNIAQMRQYPLVVLMEMKKHGWAIVPLTKGSLPLEATGRPDIDRFLGCLTMEGAFDRGVAATFAEVSGFEANIEQSRLRWNEIDLDHILWEEAAINRRRYHADFTCPALKPYLDRLVRWSKLHAIVLSEIKRSLVDDGLRCGFVVLQQARLPETLVRFYLDEFGDPDDFFCIHATNGYQNYFSNFTAPVSSRMALRNMTLHRTLRSASVPEPGEFEAFYGKNRTRGGEMLHAVQDIIRARRATEESAARLPEAKACIDQIVGWRRRGGKVACLFGKVVCDSGVPFDGGPAHDNMEDWLNHAIESVRGSNTLLLIKPHPHEIRNEIGLFMTEHFSDLIKDELPENVLLVGHRWFDVHDLAGLIDLGVIYNGTSAVELGVLDVPCVLSGHFAPIDYPIGHTVTRSREHFARLLRFEEKAVVAADLKERAAAWLTFMSGDGVAQDYRYHARQITNKRVFPPWWFRDDIDRYLAEGDRNIELLAAEILTTDGGAAAKGLEAAH